MLLTITYTGSPATDLGYLLHKNPARPQTVELSYGLAHVFYPECTLERCTAALLLDMDPIDLARGKRGSSGEGGLFDYVNDRPYVASSFLSAAISRVFGTALGGRCAKKPELAQKKLALKACITTLPCKGGEDVIRRLFEPLGYEVSVAGRPLDGQFPQWGQSRYYQVILQGEVRLSELLNHLYVLIPAMDAEKHYWVGEEEIEKLLAHGEGWLAQHPEKPLITRRYLEHRRALVNAALARLTEDEPSAGDEPEERPKQERELNLNSQRLHTVLAALKNANARSVIDLGCGGGNLLALLMKDRFFERIAGTDVSFAALSRAKEKLALDRLPENQRGRISLFQASLTYKDKRFSGYDAAAVVEVVEHMDAGRLTAFERVLFGHAQPGTVILTTPNREYNILYEGMKEGALRHPDHRFEWTRAEYKAWAEEIARRYGYTVRLEQIGDIHPQWGAPTQMGVFTKCK